jgi:hypothetical protein
VETPNEKIARWLKGDAAAIEFITGVHAIAEVWDDLIDGDQPSPADINTAFVQALIVLPRNVFYQRNFALLNPVMEAAILDWLTANALEAKGEREGLRTAFVLRCSAMTLTAMAARIIGGWAWAKQVNSEMRSQGDTWADYVAGFGG